MTGVGKDVGSVEIPIPKGGRLKLAWAAASDTGRRRSANEDSWIAKPPVFAVADGMGGHDAGDLASAAVVEQLMDAARDDWASPAGVEQALQAATEDIATVVVAWAWQLAGRRHERRQRLVLPQHRDAPRPERTRSATTSTWNPRSCAGADVNFTIPIGRWIARLTGRGATGSFPLDVYPDQQESDGATRQRQVRGRNANLGQTIPPSR